MPLMPLMLPPLLSFPFCCRHAMPPLMLAIICREPLATLLLLLPPTLPFRLSCHYAMPFSVFAIISPSCRHAATLPLFRAIY